jgi:radical SAM superfamily enzyme YgiQ (UPF0313 family)
MVAAGCRGIHYGVETGSQEILDTVKGIKKDQVLAAVRDSKKAGLEVLCSFMVPFPEDTEDTLKETTGFMKQVMHAGSEVVLSYTAPLPGTYFYENAHALGIKILTENWEEFDSKRNIIETRNLSSNAIEKGVEELVKETNLKCAIAG